MWQHVKIPLKTPDQNLYEVTPGSEPRTSQGQTAGLSIESLYPKLIKQIKILKKKLELVANAYKVAQKEKKRLLSEIDTSSYEKNKLQSEMKRLEEESKNLEEKIQSLNDEMGQMAVKLRHQTASKHGGGENIESSPISHGPKVYTSVEEKVMDETGQAGETYID